MVSVVVLSCTKEEPATTDPLVTGDLPDETFRDFTTQESDSGLTKWTLSAPTADRFTEERLIILDRPTIEFFDDFGAVQTTLVADSGSYTEDSRDMLAFGNVVVTSTDGKTLETDSLFWNNETGKIVTESFVKLTEGSDVVTGYGMECNPDLGAVDIKRDVKATIKDANAEERLKK